MTIEGYGVAWIPKAIVENDLKNGRLVRASEQTDDLVVDIKIYRSATPSPPNAVRVESFWEALRENTTMI